MISDIYPYLQFEKLLIKVTFIKGVINIAATI